jgi:hypothetical protein
MKRQPWYVSHAETIAQNVVGQIIAFIIFWCYDIRGSQGLLLQATFFVAAYARGYAIRRVFELIINPFFERMKGRT